MTNKRGWLVELTGTAPRFNGEKWVLEGELCFRKHRSIQR